MRIGRLGSLLCSAVACSAVALLAATPHLRHLADITGEAPSALRIPLLPGSRLKLPARTSAAHPPAMLGPGRIHRGFYIAPAVMHPSHVTFVAGHHGVVSLQRVGLVAQPPRSQSFLAVASYDSGIVLHNPQSFAPLGLLAIGGAPSDVAIGGNGEIVAGNTDGSTLTLVRRSPWRVRRIAGVPLTDEVVLTPNGTIFASLRNASDGQGMLISIAPNGQRRRIETGATAEGLAYDPARHIVYVGNVNDGTVLAVNARTLTPLRRIRAVPRVFGLALSPHGNLLYAVANQSRQQFDHRGYVVAIDLRARHPRIVARSRPMTFPVDVAVSPKGQRIFVTDEQRDIVNVLNAATLIAVHAPLSTCRIPWKPAVDALRGRLYIPCAGADRIDVFSLRTLRRVPGAPFRTGGYPLAVAIWNAPKPLRTAHAR
ncbi:MAG: hypothetical protein ACYDA5_07530 [Vulcanimicrobiaceae bacterium]